MLLIITYTDRELERRMTRISSFRPRGYGVFVFIKLEYTAEDCDCRYCLQSQKGICRAEGKCPYMKESINTSDGFHMFILRGSRKCNRKRLVLL